jgi:hypothetical protein
MDYPPGEFFFHYTKADTAFRHILPWKTLRLTPYSRMRDPLENQTWFFGGAYFVDPASRKKPGEVGHPETAIMEFNWKLKLAKDRAKLLALTLDADDYPDARHPFARGWARARMWELYAEAHAGVCLVFRRAPLIESVEGSLRKAGAVVYHDAVEYSDEGLSGEAAARNIPDPASLAKEDVTRAVARHLEEHHRELFFLKTRDWATEYEYRFVALKPGRKALRVNYGDALEAVIVGEKFPPWQAPAAVEACREAGAEPLRLDWKMGRPVPAKLRPTTPAASVAQFVEALRRRSPTDPPRPRAP